MFKIAKVTKMYTRGTNFNENLQDSTDYGVTAVLGKLKQKYEFIDLKGPKDTWGNHFMLVDP